MMTGHGPGVAVGAATVFLAVAVGFTGYLLARGQPTASTSPGGRVGGDGVGLALDPKDIVDVIPRNGIPAIDDPVFITPGEAHWLDQREPVISLEIDGEARAYPLQIMTWHEIVNDVIGGTPVAVTFCPLCNTAIAYERPGIDGEITTFGTSGKLINSNLVMYDRATESLWPQVTGVALTGPQEGQSLGRIPAQIVSWADFQRAYPNGTVLSRDTGHDRRYGDNPYPGYDEVGKAPFLYSGEVDGRLAAVERVLGVSVGDEVVAFPYFRLQQLAEGGLSIVQTKIASEPVVVFWKAGAVSALDETRIAASRDVGAGAAFSRKLGADILSFTVERRRILDVSTRTSWDIFGRGVAGRLKGERLETLNMTDSFWFDWAAFHPDTRVWRQ
jgi:hypothetical protein